MLPQLKPPVGAHRADVSLQSALLRIGFAGPHSLLCAGELLPRLSTLTAEAAPKGALNGIIPKLCGGISLLHFPWGHPRRPLAVILPCEARTFLIHNHVRDCSAHSHALYFIAEFFPCQCARKGKLTRKRKIKKFFPLVFRNKCFLFRNRAI